MYRRWLPVFAMALLVSCDAPQSPTATVDDLQVPGVAPRSSVVSQDTSRLWQRIAAADSTVTVGIKDPGQARGVANGRWLLNRDDFDRRLRELPAQARVIRRDPHVPAALVKVASAGALRRLRNLPFIDYVESPFLAGRGGIAPQCSGGAVIDFGGSYDGAGNLIPNIYAGMKIPEAWSLSDGSDVAVGLIDTGVDTRNPDLDHWSTYMVGADQAYDPHGHGTHQAGAVAAKRDGSYVVGVAYNSQPLGVKYGDPFWLPIGINTWRVVAALDTAVAHGAQVVNMSFESDDGSNLVSDRLDLYYSGTRGDGSRYDVLFVGAAGSGGDFGDYWYGIAFPARHDAVVAVNATRYDNNELYPGSHDGSSVELSAYAGMPSTGTQSEGFQNAKAGCSSNASAIVSGIGALVRSRYPNLTNVQARSRLRYEALDLGSSGRDWEYGYGLVNAYAAVGGFNAVKMIGNNWHDYCYATSDRTCFLVYEARNCFAETFRVIPKGDGPFQYSWSTGSTADTASMSLCPFPNGGWRYTVEVEVTKPAEGKSITLTGHIQVDPEGGLGDPG